MGRLHQGGVGQAEGSALRCPPPPSMRAGPLGGGPPKAESPEPNETAGPPKTHSPLRALASPSLPPAAANGLWECSPPLLSREITKPMFRAEGQLSHSHPVTIPSLVAWNHQFTSKNSHHYVPLELEVPTGIPAPPPPPPAPSPVR